MKFLKKMLVWSLSIILVISVGVWLFLQQAVFGKNPSGARLEKILKSPNYKDGSFQNLSFTPVMSEGSSSWQILRDYLAKSKENEPSKLIPSIKTDLKSLQAEKPMIVWFGHSSYLIKSKDVNILIDPVFSGSASPISSFVKTFEGANTYQAEDMPEIDMLFLSHDHYDHLDYQTITKLLPKVKKFYVSLGVGEHLEHWGVASDKIIEFDWWDMHKVSEEISVTATPARHFSGRSFARGKSLWSSFVLDLHSYRLFLGGDSGYDTHFKTIGEKFGPFDIAMLENGQYNVHWHEIHTMPEETFQAAKDLKAKVLMPVHWGKFALAYHAWTEPIERLKRVAMPDIKLTTPMIGEPVVLGVSYPDKAWWKN